MSVGSLKHVKSRKCNEKNVPDLQTKRQRSTGEKFALQRDHLVVRVLSLFVVEASSLLIITGLCVQSRSLFLEMNLRLATNLRNCTAAKPSSHQGIFKEKLLPDRADIFPQVQ